MNKAVNPLRCNRVIQPDYVMMLSELVVNAIEHGNLSIGYEDKSRLNKGGMWGQEVARRLNLLEYADKIESSLSDHISQK